MRKRQLLFSLILAATVSSSHPAYSQSPADPTVPDPIRQAEANDISDWALAGVVWSDANLARKLAINAYRRSENDSARANLRMVIDQSTLVIQELERFGWNRVPQSSVGNRETTENSEGTEIAVPSNREAEAALQEFAPGSVSPAESVSRAGSQPRTGMRRDQRVPANRRPGERRAIPEVVAGNPLQRYDPAPPANVRAPGIADERMSRPGITEFDQYRVDDYSVETQREALNLADARAGARADAIGGAIAAASGRRGMVLPGTDRMSKRQGWTLSATLPYITESVYDYDPDVNDMVERPAGVGSVNAASSGLDNINSDNPTTAISGVGATERGRSQIPSARMSDYTTPDQPHAADAKWVQFRLDANQHRYSMTNPASLGMATHDAVRQLQTSAMIAGRSTNSEELKQILKPVVMMEIGR